jgi:hypothetical protein
MAGVRRIINASVRPRGGDGLMQIKQPAHSGHAGHHDGAIVSGNDAAESGYSFLVKAPFNMGKTPKKLNSRY